MHPNENDSASGGLVQTPIIERTRVPRFSDRDTYYHQSPLYLPPLSRFPLTFRSRNSIRVLYPRSIDRSNNGIVIYFPARSVRIPSFPLSRGKRFTGREIESSEIYGLDSRLREGELRIVDGGTAGKHATGISTSFVETEREIRYETRDKFRFVNNPSPIRRSNCSIVVAASPQNSLLRCWTRKSGKIIGGGGEGRRCANRNLNRRAGWLEVGSPGSRGPQQVCLFPRARFNRILALRHIPPTSLTGAR